MVFHFKQTSHDFYVHEHLPFKLKGHGDAFYVYIEKQNKTTYDIIQHLRSKFGISRMTLWIAGLKDKKAIARQWISIYDRALKRLGGEVAFINALAEVAQVVDTWRHPFPLNLSVPITNEFRIKLNSEKKLGQEERQQALDIVKKMMEQWYPNLFWDQRFGINWRNASQWWEIMTWQAREKFDRPEAIFKLQAYASKCFNEYAEKRNKNKKILDWDIVAWREDRAMTYGIYSHATKTVQSCEVKWTAGNFFFTPTPEWKEIPYVPQKMLVTWPIPWYNLPLCASETPAWQSEKKFLEDNDLDAESMEKYRDYKVYGLRRPLWVFPTKTKVKYVQDNMLINFTLPAGAYASIVVDTLLEKLT